MPTTTRRAVPASVAAICVPSDREARALAEAFTVSLAWTRAQLGSWFPDDPADSLCRRLRRQSQRGLLARVRLTASRGSGQYVYFLTRQGSQVLLGSAVTPPRGQPGRDLYHSLGISDFYLALRAALARRDGELIHWWGQAASVCPLEQAGKAYINPDAAFLIGHCAEQLCLFEYDRSPNSASATQFLNKIARYLRYYERRTYREHLGQGDLKPFLLCLFNDEARLERVRTRARTLLERVVTNPPTILFGSVPAVHDPLGRVWWEVSAAAPLSLLAAQFA